MREMHEGFGYSRRIEDDPTEGRILLNVSAPFHCPLMQPAADEMAEALATATILAPRAPLVANVTAQPTLDPEAIRRMLVEQVTGRVRWRESML